MSFLNEQEKQNQSEAYLYIFDVENTLRELIIYTLKDKKNWFKQFKQKGWYLEILDGIKKEENKKGVQFLLRHPIYYTSFIQLLEIIEIFYKDFFSKVFPYAHFQNLKSTFEEIYFIRNQISHCRPIGSADLAELKAFLAQLTNMIASYGDLEIGFNNAYPIEKVLRELSVEIKNHQTIMSGDKLENLFDTAIYNKFKLQHWWSNPTFEKFCDLFSDYYKVVEKINQKRSLFLIEGELSILKYQESQHIEFFCIQVLDKIKEYIND